MGLPLLVDEDSQARLLVRRLRDAGHDVLTANEAGLSGQADSAVLAAAVATGRVLLTRNCEDFRALHEAAPLHRGILATYQDADPSKSMDYTTIVRAIHNLMETEMSLEGQFIVLNAWSY